MQGKIAYMTEPSKIEIREFNIPTEVEPDAVLMEILQTNVCGSDIHIFEGNHPQRSYGGLGHEMVGRVIKLGENVTTDRAGNPIKVGDRIVPVFFATCNTCEPCLNGNYHSCVQKFKYRGNVDEYPHFQGVSFATHNYVHPDQYFFKVPESLSNEEVVSSNCALSQVIYGLSHLDIKFGDYLVIQGAGGLGINACAVAKEKGAEIIVVDGVEERLNVAKNFGADHVISLNEFDTLDKRIAEVNRITKGRGANFALEVTGVPQAFNEGINYLRQSGKYVPMGNIGTGKIEIEPGLLVRNSIQVLPFTGYNPKYLYEALKFLERNAHNYPFDQLLDCTFTLEETQTAIEKSISREVTRATIKVK